MRTDTRLGTCEDVLRASPPPVASITRRLRRLIKEVAPDVLEVPRPAEQHVHYAIGQGKANEVFGYLCPMQDYVRLGFYFGGGLPDPGKHLEGTGKRLRHIKIYSPAEAAHPAIRRIVTAAVRERKKALGVK